MTQNNQNTVRDGKVVSVHYTLRNPAGKVIDSSDGEEPMSYLHGASNIVPGLERQLAGKSIGDKVKAVVPPEEGYGERVGGAPQVVPRNAFPADAELEEGMPFAVEGPQGQVVELWISRIEGDQIYVDRNHPLAGVALHFDVEILEIRDASRDEIAHGHPHGPGGHH